MIVDCNFLIFPDVYCGEVSNQLIPTNVEKLILRGKHLKGKSNDDLRRFFFTNGSLQKFPTFFGDSFSKIEELFIRGAELKSITKNDLKIFKNLRILNLNGNQLEFLPGDLFEFSQKIETIDFGSNRIKFIGPALLDNLPNLKSAKFYSNPAVTKNYTSDPNDNDRSKTTLDELIRLIRTDCKPPLSEIEMQEQIVKRIEEEKLKNLLKSAQTICGHHLFNLLDDMQKFFILDDHKDFTIKVCDREFKVHKFLFMARSETFAELIKNNPEAEDLVLQDISVEVFESVLSYIYTDQLPHDQNLHEVFAAAGRLKIKGLMHMTIFKLTDSIKYEENLEILFKILTLSDKFEQYDYNLTLKMKAFEEIKKHFPGKILKNDLAGQPEKLKKIIDMKMKLDQQIEEFEKEDDGEMP